MYDVEYGDKIILDRGIDIADLSIHRLNQIDPNSYNVWKQSDLIIDIAGHGSITIKNQYQYDGLQVYGIETIELSNGSRINLEGLCKYP